MSASASGSARPRRGAPRVDAPGCICDVSWAMRQEAFEAKVLELWTRTRIPLTRANLIAYTKLPRAQLDRMLDEMVRGRLIELDSDDEGELLWTVRGAARPRSGPETVAELEKKDRLSEEVEKLSSGAQLALRAAGFNKPATPAAPGERKSVIASGALSFFFGPLGWLYAAPLKEAIPAVIVYALLYSILSAILPSFILFWIFGPLSALSAVAGALYAWSYNQEGRRSELWWTRAKKALPPTGRR